MQNGEATSPMNFAAFGAFALVIVASIYLLTGTNLVKFI